MKDFVTRLFTTASGILGLLLVASGFAGLIPWFGYGLSFEGLVAGFGLIILGESITRRHVEKLDPALDKLVGDATSARIQELLVAALVNDAVDEETAQQIAAAQVQEITAAKE